MIGYLFAVPREGSNLHDHLFSALKVNKISAFVDDGLDRIKLTFYANSAAIFVRSPVLVKGIQMREEVLDVKQGDRVKGKVTLSNYIQKTIPKEERENKVADGKKVKEKHYVSLSYKGQEFINHITSLLNKNGLNDIKDLSVIANPHGDFIYVGAAKKSFFAAQVSFNAKIEDLTLFEKAWFNGIGRQKTYGFGMLRVVKDE